MPSASGTGGCTKGTRGLLPPYNEAGCVNLQPLVDAFYCRLVRTSGLEEVPV